MRPAWKCLPSCEQRKDLEVQDHMPVNLTCAVMSNIGSYPTLRHMKSYTFAVNSVACCWKNWIEISNFNR